MISRTGKYRLFPIAGYAATISAVFLIAVPVAALSILATWIIPQVELRQWPEDGPAAPGAGTAAGDATAPRQALPGDAQTRQPTPQPPVTHKC